MNKENIEIKNTKSRTFCMGDLHGCHKALVQCLERSEFNYETDTLIQLGDICDGWSETYECVEELLKIKNLIPIRGNHDDEFGHWMLWGIHRVHWLHGAKATAESYIKHADRDDIRFMPNNGGYITNLTSFDIPPTHQKLFRDQDLYYVDGERNMCFVHGGFNRHISITDQSIPYIYFWDRDLWNSAMSYSCMNEESKKKNKFKMKNNFSEVFIGHTATTNWSEFNTPITTPMKAANIWNLDTGAGFNGKLTIMDVDTKEFYQSDLVRKLYPNERGRK